MCEADKRFLLYLLFALLCAFAAGALRAEEQWYLISETELRSIEQYKETSEREKRDWLSRVRLLNNEADILHQDSADLNSQLAQARARGRKLEQSFNEYEQGQLILTSLKNGEIADLKQKTEKYKGIARSRLFIIIALGAAWVVFFAFKASRFFRLIK